ncbi:NAD-dependent epimerase/dehydratase family protein [Nocardioides iriomotensis]|uniref:NAD-dependent epimerase/dehydratase family protein n=1 Tax=Nocardioides iriomotensis TaxID=715784 RepID=A0A4Q5IVY9_9ACTN|nr:NAD-dependent epimerase/dehydratase family protein [Nocardioides iriomotensis]RYU10237.1 NAD-dependent epimerase/dehydratase family protein [Nocardioides iriomotensis]
MSTLLVLGGTSWLGGAVARHARDAGHDVTCLARGSSGSVPDGVTWVTGDRDDPAAAYTEVASRDRDAVVDVARQPVHVRGALDALAARAGHWLFVSTCSVYADNGTPGADESAALHEPWVGPDPLALAPDEEYGPAKVACEQAVLAARPDALVARSGLIVGYGDRSDRFGYWPARFARAAGSPHRDVDGEVLLAPRDQALQVVDVEDFAAWLVRCAADRTGGVVNAMSPSLTLGDLYDACAAALDGPPPAAAEPSDGWLQGREVTPWMGPDSLPLWLPQPEYAGFMTRDVAAAEQAGLTFRPLAEIVRASLAWERERGLDRDRRAGLTPAYEAELVTAWRAEAPGTSPVSAPVPTA